MELRPRMRLDPANVTRMLGLAAALLVLASLLGDLALTVVDGPMPRAVVRRFDLDRENNIPTFFSSAMLLLCSGLLYVVSSHARAERRPYARHWTVLSFIVLAMAVDEAASLHEILVRPLEKLGAGGVFHFGWVIVGVPVVLLLALGYLRFLLHLPDRSKMLFTLAGIVYFSGAVGMELLGGRHAAQFGLESQSYNLFTTIEEGLELAGIVLLVHALLDHIARANGAVVVGIEAPAPVVVASPAPAEVALARAPSST